MLSEQTRNINKLINHNKAYLESVPKINYDSFSLKISKFYTDVDGTILDKSTVPDALMVPFPVYLFNAYDQAGGYLVSNRQLPEQPGTFYLYNATINGAFDLLQFSGANNIRNQLKSR